MAVRRRLLLLLIPLLLISSSSFRPSLALSEAEALLRVKSSFNQTGAIATWAAGKTPCQAKWAGIMCFNGIITGLHLTGMGLSGVIDIDALIQIRGLRTISLVNNSFTGPMPEFNRLGVVKSLLLSGNSFSGEIPTDFFSHLNSLKKVWLNGNQFSGKIPSSLVLLKNLIELHLENNRFAGVIPEFTRKIPSLDMSNNLLEGEIPEVFSAYGVESFKGNEGLCGKPLEKACTADGTAALGDGSSSASAAAALAERKDNNTKLIVGGVIATMVGVLLYALLSSKNGREGEEEEESRRTAATAVSEEEAERTSSSHKSAMGSGRRSTAGGAESKKGSNNGGGSGMTDLIMVNEERGISFGLSDLMKAAAEVLGNGGLGSAYKAVMTSGMSVAVKRMREMNRLGREGFDAEMRRFGRLRHRNILTPLAYHYRREEKLLVSEYIPKGSLLYVLHGDRGSVHAELNWATRLKIAKGVARGLGFLYSEFSGLELPHGNLKSSNVLLGEDHEPVLSDYAFQPLMNPASAAQAMFAYRTPDFAHLRRVSHKTDVYCLGLIFLEILTGKFPSQYLTNGKGGTDVVDWALSAAGDEDKEADLLDPDMLAGAGPGALPQMLHLLSIAAACVDANPNQRMDIREAISKIDELHAA